MNFPTTKRAHNLQAGDQIKAYFDGAVLTGFVESVRNSPRQTTIQMEEDGSLHVVSRTMPVEILNARKPGATQ